MVLEQPFKEYICVLDTAVFLISNISNVPWFLFHGQKESLPRYELLLRLPQKRSTTIKPVFQEGGTSMGKKSQGEAGGESEQDLSIRSDTTCSNIHRGEEQRLGMSSCIPFILPERANSATDPIKLLSGVYGYQSRLEGVDNFLRLHMHCCV
jgi:hypothetical protein